MKSIKLQTSQLNLIKKGAKAIILPLDTGAVKMSEIGLKNALLAFSPIQKGDSGISVKEAGSDMIFKDSIYTIDCIELELTRVREIHTARKIEAVLGTNYMNNGGTITIEDFDVLIKEFKEAYNKQMLETGSDRTYEDNDYIFLCYINAKKEAL